MRAFTQLYTELEQTNRTADKLAILERYFRAAPPADAAWALYFLAEKRLPRAVTTPRLRDWAGAAGNVPLWLVDECFDAVGDLGETLAWLVPGSETGIDQALHAFLEERLLPLRELPEMHR